MIWVLSLLLASQVGIFSPSAFVPQPAGGISPTFVSGRSSTSATSALGTITDPGGCPTDTYCVSLPAPSLANNLITATVLYTSTPSTTISVTTDQSQTMTALTASSAESSRIQQSFYLCGATTSTRALEITATSAITIEHVFVHQYAGVATTSCLDTHNSNAAATSTTFTAGSITPAQSGDLLEMVGCAAGTPARTSFTVGSQTNITWAKRGDDIIDGCMAQWGVYSSTSAINPQFTTSPTSTFIGTVMAFKPSSSSGTLPTGMYPIYEAAYNTPLGTTVSSKAVEFPSTGNLVTLQIASGGLTVSSLTDGTNSWKVPGWYSTGNPSGTVTAFSNFAYAANASANTSGALTVNLTELPSGSGVDATMMFIDWAGAATAPFGTRAYNASGAGTNNTTSTGYTYLTNYYPQITNGWILGTMGQGLTTAIGSPSPSGAYFQSSTFGSQPVNGPSWPDQNNCWMLYQITSNATQSMECSYIPTGSGQNIREFGGEAISLLSSTGSFSGPRIIQAPYNTGSSGTTIAVTMASTQSSSVLAAVIQNHNTLTVTKVCTDGTTCGAGNSFTKITGATASQSNHESEIWYLTGHAAGVTTVTVTYSGTISNAGMKVFELAGVSALDTSNGLSNGTGASNVNTGASITTSGSPDIAVSITVTGGTTEMVPNDGNIFTYDDLIFSTSGDATGALIGTGSSIHFDTYDLSSATGFCNSVAAFK